MADLDDRNVQYPNHVYITIRGNKNCDLDVACQLTLQPEKIDENLLKLQQMQKKTHNIDYNFLSKIENKLNEFYVHNKYTPPQNYVNVNIRKAENFPVLYQK